MLVETFIRKQLGLKAHTVMKVEETERYMVVRIDRLGRRLLRCGVCRQRCRKVHSVRKAREWRDLSMRKLPLKLRYRPRRGSAVKQRSGRWVMTGRQGICWMIRRAVSRSFWWRYGAPEVGRAKPH